MSKLTCYLVTGLSGAGKSHALQIFEDLGISCVDNLPGELVESFVEVAGQKKDESKVALILDVREKKFVNQFPELLEFFEDKSDVQLKIIFLEASTEELLRRYQESRRPHPLSENLDLKKAIEKERELLKPVRKAANLILDTTRINIHQLKRLLADLVSNSPQKNLVLSLVSFGFKNGPPAHLDFLFDCRFLPNPYYEPQLKEKTGLDKEIEDYFAEHPEVNIYLNRVGDFLDPVIDSYHKTDKLGLSVGLGCTGGRHRSVFLVEQLAKRFTGQRFLTTSVTHRDLAEEVPSEAEQ